MFMCCRWYLQRRQRFSRDSRETSELGGVRGDGGGDGSGDVGGDGVGDGSGEAAACKGCSGGGDGGGWWRAVAAAMTMTSGGCGFTLTRSRPL